MHILESITENETIAHFLQTEISSDRFSEKIFKYLSDHSLDRDIIDSPVLQDENQNNLRKKMLLDLRTSTFHNFPNNVEWFRATLSRHELERVKYINYSYWNELSNGTRLPCVAAKSVIEGKIVYGQANDGFFKASEFLKQGGKFPKLILVSTDKESELVVLEGHLRITAYFIDESTIPDELEVIIGFSPDMVKWDVL